MAPAAWGSCRQIVTRLVADVAGGRRDRLSNARTTDRIGDHRTPAVFCSMVRRDSRSSRSSASSSSVSEPDAFTAYERFDPRFVISLTWPQFRAALPRRRSARAAPAARAAAESEAFAVAHTLRDLQQSLATRRDRTLQIGGKRDVANAARAARCVVSAAPPGRTIACSARR